MDRTIWVALRELVRGLNRPSGSRRPTFSDADIILTFLWAVLNGRPVSWACRPDAWPIFERHVRRPSPSRMSRRLRTRSVQALLESVQRALAHDPAGTLGAIIDGKVLRVARHSRDKQATFGGAGLRGYKLHLACDLRGRILGGKVTPLHCHEAVMARRLLRSMPLSGYLLADANYDSVALHEQCAAKGAQLVAPRMRSRVGRPLDRRCDTPPRRRAITMLEFDRTGFGTRLYGLRSQIERVFGRLEMRHHLGVLPPHVRGLARVRSWIAAVIVLDLARTNPRLNPHATA